MEENPFIVTGAIQKKYFCDRERETKRIIRCVTSGENIVLMSPRRLGKTGLIYHCFDDEAIRGNFSTLFVDILRTSSLNEFTFLLGKTVFNEIGRKSQALMKMIVATLKSINGSFGYDPISGMPTFDLSLGQITNPEYTLEEIFQCLEQADKRCIVAIDEFQQIASYPEKNTEAILRTFIQQAHNVNFVFSGSERHLLEEMFRNAARPFYNSADTLSMEPIDKDVYTTFAAHLFTDCGKSIDSELIHHIYDFFDGNTYYNQKTLHEAFEETPSEGWCTEAIIQKVIEDLLLDNHRKFSEMLSLLTLPQKELLYAISKDHYAPSPTSAQFIKRHSLRSASSVQASMKKLLEYHMISRSSSGYYVDDSLMQHWLNR